jgi:hypothetical protein
MSRVAAHSSKPVRESKALKRRSLLAPMNSSPAAVVIGPPMFNRPVRCFGPESCSVIPSGTRHAMSPVCAFTATRFPHGGFWHGHAFSPAPWMLPPPFSSPSLDWKRDVVPTMLFLA